MPLSVRLQQRDLNLLQDIGQSRFLTYGQVADLWFNGSQHAARKRIQKLKNASLVSIVQPAIRNQALILLTRPGAARLRTCGFGTKVHPSAFESPGSATLEHEIALRDLKVFWSRGQTSGDPNLQEFNLISNDLEFTTQFGRIRPDAYVRTKQNFAAQPAHFFLELDQGTEALKLLEWKIIQYWLFYREGGFASRMGLPRINYKLAPFRVILVFNNHTRLQALSKRLMAKGFHSFVCVSTFSEMSKSTTPIHKILRALPQSARQNEFG